MKKIFISAFLFALAFIASIPLLSSLPFPTSAQAFSTSAYLQTQNEHIIDWGLTPSKNEQIPPPPDFAATMLSEGNGIYLGDTRAKNVYLTFDLGYEAGFTAEVLDILKDHNIKAIFFLCGHYLNEKILVERMLNEGHSIGNHTNKHKDLPILSDEEIKEDITAFSRLFQEKFGNLADISSIKHFRPPKGRISARVLSAAKNEGLKTVMWSSAIVDWGKTPINARLSADKLANRLHPGNIILLHISNAGTPAMLKMLIPQILQKGYTVADAGEL